MNELIEIDDQPEDFDFGEMPAADVRALYRSEEAVRCIIERQRATTSENVVEIGRVLADAQERLSHHKTGGFAKWVKARFGFSHQTAYNAISAMRVTSNRKTVLRFIAPSALYLIAAESCPEKAREEVFRIAGTGKVVSKKVAAELVEKHKPKPPAITGAAASRVENPVPGDSGQDTDRQGAGVSPGPVAAAPASSPPAPSVIETTATVVSDPPKADANPTAADLLPELSRLNNRLRKVTETVDGQPLDGKELARHVVCVVDALSGEAPSWRLVKAGDPAWQVEAIYAEYPRKTAPAEGKKAISKALKKVGFDELLDAVREYARSREGKDPQFTPHPATWFNGGRWEDDRAEWFRAETRGNGNGKPRGRTDVIDEYLAEFGGRE